ncbi:hypothetical protein BDN72DRAFT_864836 [Pluteus cervinus]|uniref:Uncharacterized protein n=1 Tax=Pluteus cervinus TaxID=181527 RepID=A0ACD3A2C8_9AGAR|nr:hypothetical protein BDN72DRAFT_864836 [Pluteus cervinus]
MDDAKMVERERNRLDAEIRILELALAELHWERGHNRPDAETRELQLALLELKRKHNSLSPIMRLSPDILLYIFEYLQEEAYGCDLDTFPLDNPLLVSTYSKVSVMTHVCSPWRNIALSTATVWTAITFRNDSEAYAAEMLERSCNAPLSIAFIPDHKIGHVEDTLLLHVLNTEMHRIRSLAIRAPDDSIQTHLNELDLNGNSAMEALSFWTWDVLAHGSLIKFLKPSSNTLRFLDVFCPWFDLQKFTGTITLPKLSRVRLQGPKIMGLLTRFVIPPTCHLPSDSDTPNVSISIDSDLPQAPDIFMNFEHDLPCEGSILPTPVIKDLLSCFALSQLTTIVFTDKENENFSFPSTIWIFLAEECSNVQSLIVHEFDCEPLCPALLIRHQNDAKDGVTIVCNSRAQFKGPYPFPNLKALKLHSISIDAGEDKDASVISNLEKALESRFKAGIPLDELVLDRVRNVETQHIPVLEPFVQRKITFIPRDERCSVGY